MKYTNLIRSKECTWNVHLDTLDVDHLNLKRREMLALYFLGSISADRLCLLWGIPKAQLEGFLEQFHELLDEYTENK